MREVYIAIAQFHPRLNEPQANLDRVSDIIDHICAGQKVNLIVFPELATSGYECGGKFTELAEQLPGYTIETLGARVAGRGVPRVWYGRQAQDRKCGVRCGDSAWT